MCIYIYGVVPFVEHPAPAEKKTDKLHVLGDHRKNNMFAYIFQLQAHHMQASLCSTITLPARTLWNLVASYFTQSVSICMSMKSLFIGLTKIVNNVFISTT